MDCAFPLYAEHPQDVLGQWLQWRQAGPVALVIVTKTEGGSVRSPGALMAVAADGRKSGYISGGCVDADVALQARQAITDGKTVHLRYGTGSPFIDMPLPCGGAIEVAILPAADETSIRDCYEALQARQHAQLALAGIGQRFRYMPKIRVRIAGRGADALALARLVAASGYELSLQLRDGEDIAEARMAGFDCVIPLQSPETLPPASDDAWTAFILMFHDPDWETALLKQALKGQAFYVGAVGSYRTQERRREHLRADGIPAAQIARVRGPVGLVPSTRDASMLAVSALAEIVAAYRELQAAPFAETAILLLAAGQSARFAAGDKLLAPLHGKPVISYAADLLAADSVAARIAVIGPEQEKRRRPLEAAGWQVLINPDATSGQASSLKAGMKAVAAVPGVQRVLVLLADMPFVSAPHLRSLSAAMTPGDQAVISAAGDILCPPAIFSKTVFSQLSDVSGDRGALGIFRSLTGTKTVAMPAGEAIDIDTTEDLAHAAGTVPA